MPKPLIIVAALLLLVGAGCVSVNFDEKVPEDCAAWKRGYTEYLEDGSVITRAGYCLQTR